MKKLFRYLKPYKWQVVLVTLLTFVQALSQLYLPNLMSDIVDEGVVGEDIGFIIKTGIVMLIFTYNQTLISSLIILSLPIKNKKTTVF